MSKSKKLINLSTIRKIGGQNRVALPLEFMKVAGWAIGDELLLTYNWQDDTVILELAEKNAPTRGVGAKRGLK